MFREEDFLVIVNRQNGVCKSSIVLRASKYPLEHTLDNLSQSLSCLTVLSAFRIGYEFHWHDNFYSYAATNIFLVCYHE